MTRPAAAQPSGPRPIVPPPQSGSPESRLGPLTLGMLILLWGYVIYHLGTLWHSNPDYGFGWFVPVLCLCLLWERWKRRPVRSPVRPAGGTFFLLGMFGLSLPLAALFLEIVPNWRFAGWIFAGAAIGITCILLYFLGGRSWSRYFAFPVIFFLIAVPWPSRLEKPLIGKMSELNAVISTVSANILGSPAIRRGVVIETGPGLVGIDEACSGIRSFQASVMVALFLGELFSYGFLRRGFLLFGAVALAFVANVVRTTYLVRVADLHGIATVNLYHDRAGFAILGITLAGLLILVWLLRPKRNKGRSSGSPRGAGMETASSRLEREKANQTPDQAAQTAFGPSRWAQPRLIKAALAIFVVWVLVAEMGIHYWFNRAEKQAEKEAAWSLKPPTQAAEYHELPVSEIVTTTLKYDEGRKVEWRDDGGCVWQLFYFRWLPAETPYRAAVTGEQARGHATEGCLQLAGMVLQTDLGTQTVTMNGIPLLVKAQRFLDQGRDFHVFTCDWAPANHWISQAAAGTGVAFHSVLQALKTRDRGWNEKRVIKAGVWGKTSDEAAQAAFREYLRGMISNQTAGKV